MEGFVAYQGALGKTKYFQLLTSDTNHLSPAIQNLFFFESWICRSCIYTYIFLSESSSKNEMILSKSKPEGFFTHQFWQFEGSNSFIRMAAAISGVRTLQVATKKGIWGKGRTLISKMPLAATTVTAYRIPQKCCEICLEIQAHFLLQKDVNLV